MNKFLKSALCVAGVAGAFSAAEAQAVSFTVVIDKIELVKDADNYPNTAVTVYDPAPGATSTVDLFNATQKLGTTFTLNKPGSGEYESAVIYFSNITAVSGSDSYDMMAQYTNSGLMGTLGSEAVMVLGDDGDGTADSLQGVYAQAMAPMQSIIADGTNDITMPTLDLYMPSGNVVKSGPSAIAVTQLPRALLSVSTASDSASRANVLVDVDADTAFTDEASWTLGASVVTVGLFSDVSGVVPEYPVTSQTFTAASPAAVNYAIEFIDVPNGTFQPIAWIDEDEDGLLDTDEAFTVGSLTKATNRVTVSGTSDISTTATAGILDTLAIDFPARTITLAISMTNDTSVTAADNYATNGNEDAASGLMVRTEAGTALTGATAAGAMDLSLTISIYTDVDETISTSYSLPVKAAMENTVVVTGDSLLENTEIFNLVLDDASVSFSDYGSLNYNALAAQSALEITGVPAWQPTTFAATNAGGNYKVRLYVTDGTESAYRELDETGAGGFEQAIAIDADDRVPVTGGGTVDLGNAAGAEFN